MREPWFSGCILCGVYFDGERDSWSPYLRAVYNENANSSKPKLSGVTRFWQGVVSPFPLDENHSVSYSMLNLMDSSQARAIWPYRYHARIQRPPPQTVPGMRFAWGVVFHDVCFKYLCEISGGRENVSIEALNALCMACPVQRYTMNFGHDYGGIMKYRTERQNLFPGDEPEFATPFATADRTNTHETKGLPALRYAPYDPDALPEVDLCIHRADDTNLVHRRSRIRSVAPDCFSTLPVEIIQTILINLPTTAVLHIRIASRVVNEVELPEVFWASRFHPGFEFYCVSKLPIVIHSRPTCSWQVLYRSFCTIKISPHFRNRRRIWDVLLYMHDLLKTMEAYSERHGEVSRHEPVRTILRLGGPFTQLASRQKIVTAAVREYPDVFPTGCRPQWSGIATLPGAIVSVYASLIMFGGVYYIAGLHIVGDNQYTVDIGYKHEHPRLCFNVGDSTSIEEIVIAADSRGLRGVQFTLFGGLKSIWVGDHEGLPKQRLLIDESSQDPPDLLCQLDRLKMLSLAAVPKASKTRMPRKRFIRSLRNMEIRDKHHWIPDIPSNELHLNANAFLDWKFPNPTNSRCFQPLTIVHFGGAKGIFLNKLTALVAYRGANDYFCSLEFHYCMEINGSKVHRLGYNMACTTEDELGYCLSRWKPVRTQFTIDGPGGEVITGMEWQRRPKGRLEGFSVTTNRRHTGSFLKEPPTPWDLVTKPMSIDPETTITGIYAAVQRRVGIISLGVISEKL